jgi:hypothetical protein
MKVQEVALSVLFWVVVGACVGLLIRFIRHRVRCSRARRFGDYPPDKTRIWVAPLIAIGTLLGAQVVIGVGASFVLGTTTPQQRLAKQMKRQSEVQVALAAEFQRPPARSYLDLDARVATVRRLRDEASDVQAALRRLDRKQYDAREAAAIAALDAMLTADLAYMDGYRQVIGQRKVQITEHGVTLPPAELDAMLQRQITVTTRAIAMIDPYVALRAIRPAEGAKLRAQLQAAVAKLQAARAAAHPPATNTPKGA